MRDSRLIKICLDESIIHPCKTIITGHYNVFIKKAYFNKYVKPKIKFFINYTSVKNGYYKIRGNDFQAVLSVLYSYGNNVKFFFLNKQKEEDISLISKELSSYLKDFDDIVDANVDQEIYCINLFSSEEKMVQFINIVYNILESENFYTILKDFVLVKDDLMDSLRCVLSEEDFIKWEGLYSRYLELGDSRNLKIMYENAHKLFLESWKGYTTKIEDYVPGEPFKFLCHSVSEVFKSRKFASRFVSSSLITNILMDVFNEGFGFIIEPLNIVVAGSEDMDVNNDANSVENIFYSRVGYGEHYKWNIPIINAPEKILNDCYARLNSDDNCKKVYSEIVTDGFKPIGIFCITDGSKGHENYCNALKLKKVFPELEIVEINKTLYFKDDNDLALQKKLAE